MKANKVLAMTLAMAMTAGMLAGCGSSEKEVKETKKVEDSASEGEQITLNYWTWFPSKDQIQETVDAFEKENPDIKINMTVIDVYKRQEDDRAISELLCMNLEAAGYETVAAYDGEEAQRLLLWHEDADMAVVDIMLPGKNGFALMEDFKKKDIPVIYLTAKDDVASKVKGLKLGAEDYMVKPFEMLELLVRIEKVLERTGRARKVLTIRNIMVDMQSHQVYKDGLPVSLKPMEYDLFVLLLQNKNIALGREELLKRVWGEDYLGESRTVDVHIGQLRKKLELYDEIRTIPKLGYRLEE